jgi:mannose-6-phosphate isomerase-like protein (cupin superfamily)
MPLRKKTMKKTILITFAGLLALPAITFAQAPPNSPPPPGQPGGGPAYAFDIPKSAIDMVLKNDPGTDRQLRVVDMGKYNVGVGIIHRGPTNDKPGDPIPAIFHYYTPEIYIIVSGGGVLTTGGVIDNFRASQGVPNVMNGPSGGGVFGRGAYSRRVVPGDVIIIPTGVGHGWSQVTDHVDYLSIRPDPEKVLPAGWVYPLLLKNVPEEVKTGK